MKRICLLVVIVSTLISLSLYSTYAMFTANVETDDFVNLSISNLTFETKILEYKQFNIKAGEARVYR